MLAGALCIVMEQIPSLQLPFKATTTQMTQGYFVGNSKQKI